MIIDYWILRLIRHFMPAVLARFFLRRGWVIHPGVETSDPKRASERYLNYLAGKGWNVEGKRVMVFGYGGNFGIACSLLDKGANHVVLVEKGVSPDDARNRVLIDQYSSYLRQEGKRVLPDPRIITLLQGDIRQIARTSNLNRVNLVLSSSVFEHLDDVQGINAALCALSSSEGAALHFIDLRDHFFKYPFEMLCYSEKTWNGWLNPSSHLNRWRLKDYRQLFEGMYRYVDIQILQREEEQFLKYRERIKSEFLSGNLLEDSAAMIAIFCKNPIR